MLNTQPEMPARVGATLQTDTDDFSLVSGGALFRLWRRTRLSGDAMQFTRRRVLAVIAITWVPLLVLSILEGHAWGSGVALHVPAGRGNARAPPDRRAAAPVRGGQGPPGDPVHRARVRHRGLVTDAARPRFDAAIASALRLRNSVVAELLLLVFVYGVGMPFVWRDQVALDVNSWYATAVDGRLHPFARRLVGGARQPCPSFQFLCLRWYFRMLIWARFLWQVSRIDPQARADCIRTAPPDCISSRSSERAYRPVLLGTGHGARRNDGQPDLLRRREAARLQGGDRRHGGAADVRGARTAALLLAAAARGAAQGNGATTAALGQRYAREFHRKWMGGGPPAEEPLLGSADIQSLADLRNGYLVVDGMHVVPFSMRNVMCARGGCR